jgi:hypothetical protein
MNDLVQRLRERHMYLYQNSPLASCLIEAADTIEALRRQVEELTQYGVKLDEWNDELQEQLAAMTQERDECFRRNAVLGNENKVIEEQLAAAQADNARLREALAYVLRVEDDALETKTFNRIKESLALPTDHAALDARLKAERERCAECVESVYADSRMEIADAIRSLT